MSLASKRRHLAAMGIPVWVRRDGSADNLEGADDTAPGRAVEAAPARASGSASGRAAGAATGPDGRTAAPAGRRVPATAAPGAPARRPMPTDPAGDGAAAPRAGRPAATGAAWDALAAEVRGCTLCGLHATRTQTVFGVGRRDADLLVIGEAPGADEDRQGEPFVGRAGQLLNAMLKGIGFARGEVYIANILKCRPPGNRDPKPEESALCTPYLDRQIALINPRAILALGRIAAQWLLQSEEPIGRLRGRVSSYGEWRIPIVVTYHPAYLLRSPLAKGKSWQDLVLVKELLSRDR